MDGKAPNKHRSSNKLDGKGSKKHRSSTQNKIDSIEQLRLQSKSEQQSIVLRPKHRSSIQNYTDSIEQLRLQSESEQQSIVLRPISQSHMTAASTIQQPFMQQTFMPQPFIQGPFMQQTLMPFMPQPFMQQTTMQQSFMPQPPTITIRVDGDLNVNHGTINHGAINHGTISHTHEHLNVSGQGEEGARIQEGDIVREAEVQERDGNGDDVVSENIDVSANNNIQERGEWSCSRCTLRNRRDSLSCDCGTPRFPNRVPGVNFFDLTRAVDADSSLNPRYQQGNVRERPLTPILLD